MKVRDLLFRGFVHSNERIRSFDSLTLVLSSVPLRALTGAARPSLPRGEKGEEETRRKRPGRAKARPSKTNAEPAYAEGYGATGIEC
jgi:hypothetical protein